MKKTPPPASPEAYVAAIGGWRRDCVDLLRSAVRAVPSVKEEVFFSSARKTTAFSSASGEDKD